MLSLAVSVLVGWQRGGTAVAQILLAAIGILAVLGAHWLLPLLRAVPTGVVIRLVGVLLWLACLAYAATSHADFFIGVQTLSAEQRVATIESVDPSAITAPTRSLSAILEDDAAVRVKWMQARFAGASCESNCEVLKIRQIALKSRVTALEAEGEEARRWQVMQDQLRQRKAALLDDPVTSRLQRDFGVTPAVSSAITVLPAAVILEGLGAFCWCLVLRGQAKSVTRRPLQAATLPVTSKVTDAVDGQVDASPLAVPVVPAVTTSTTAQATESVTAEAGHDDGAKERELQALVAKVWVEIQAGRVQPTVRAIRANLGIAQEQARAVAQVIRDWQAAGTLGA